MRAKLIDISRYQVNPDANRIRAEGYCGVAIRATVGNYYTDASFSAHWEKFRQAGFMVSAYHVLTPEYDAESQLARFFQAMGDKTPDFPITVDVELDRGQTASTIQNRLLAVLKGLYKKYNRDPIIYTSGNWWNSYMGVHGVYPAWACVYPLWVAEYHYDPYPPYVFPENEVPTYIPKGWGKDKWTLFQWTGKGRFNGQEGLFDKDVARISEEEFREWAEFEPRKLKFKIHLPFMAKEISHV